MDEHGQVAGSESSQAASRRTGCTRPACGPSAAAAASNRGARPGRRSRPGCARRTPSGRTPTPAKPRRPRCRNARSGGRPRARSHTPLARPGCRRAAAVPSLDSVRTRAAPRAARRTIGVRKRFEQGARMSSSPQPAAISARMSAATGPRRQGGGGGRKGRGGSDPCRQRDAGSNRPAAACPRAKACIGTGFTLDAPSDVTRPGGREALARSR